MRSALEGSQQYGGLDTTAQTSYFDSKFVSKRIQSVESKVRSQRSPASRYRHIATRNIKFEKFIELIFKSRMQTSEIQDEIIKYVQALETSYTDAIKELKVAVDRERKDTKRKVADTVNKASERNELEALFIDCIEEVRKDIMKRRLKNEIYNRKKFQ